MSKLYTPQLLSLAAHLANFPLNSDHSHHAEARSRTCGSTIAIGFDMDAANGVNRVGMLVSACAIGQGSAAIMASGSMGRQQTAFSDTLKGLEEWLAGKAALPHWPGIDALEPALDHPGRHGALLLPWQAAVSALSTQPLSSNPASR